MGWWITYSVVHEKVIEATGAGIVLLTAAEVMVGLEADIGGLAVT